MKQESMGSEKIHSFTQLLAWKEGHGLVISIYQLVEGFPNKEQFGLSNQICRAAVSITSNIAEGFSRTSKKEKAQFYAMAHGSLSEVQNQLLIARDVGCISNDQFQLLATRSILISKLLNGLIRRSRETLAS